MIFHREDQQVFEWNLFFSDFFFLVQSKSKTRANLRIKKEKQTIVIYFTTLIINNNLFPIIAVPANYESLGHLKVHKDFTQTSADAEQQDEPMSDDEQVSLTTVEVDYLHSFHSSNDN